MFARVKVSRLEDNQIYNREPVCLRSLIIVFNAAYSTKSLHVDNFYDHRENIDLKIDSSAFFEIFFEFEKSKTDLYS